MEKETTSERLKKYMKMHNLKQVDILEKAKPYAKEYGIKLNKNDLSQYVSGKVEPGQNKTFILSKALNINPAWLMGYDVEMKENTDTETIKKPALTKPETTLLTNYNKLNNIGQNEASKRVEELTYIDKYKKVPEHLQVVAAHLDGELTDEVKKFIEDF